MFRSEECEDEENRDEALDDVAEPVILAHLGFECVKVDQGQSEPIAMQTRDIAEAMTMKMPQPLLEASTGSVWTKNQLIKS